MFAVGRLATDTSVRDDAAADIDVVPANRSAKSIRDTCCLVRCSWYLRAYIHVS